MDIQKVSLNPWTVTRPLALAAALFVAIHIAMSSYWILSHREYVSGFAWLSLDKEQSLPSLFSTFLLVAASALFAFVAMVERVGGSRDFRQWQILAMGFAVMAVDENLAFHERLIGPMQHLLGGGHLGILHFAWVLPALVLVAVLGVYFLPFLRRLPRRSMIAFVVSGAIYLGGAVGVELFEGWWREEHSYRTIAFHLSVALEEGMEMAGVIILIHSLLRHLSRRFGDVQIHFEGAAVEEAFAVHPAGQPSPHSP
ncbi:hypothetical protein [Lysobacter tyrosinilyticus]